MFHYGEGRFNAAIGYDTRHLFSPLRIPLPMLAAIRVVLHLRFPTSTTP